jgi:hypothetical protein
MTNVGENILLTLIYLVFFAKYFWQVSEKKPRS